MTDQSFSEQIDRYLEGNLDPAQTRAFEAALQTDPELAAELSLKRDTYAARRLLAKEALKAQMRGWYAEMEAAGEAPDLEKMNRERLRRIWVKAGLAILAGIFLIWLFFKVIPESGSGSGTHVAPFPPGVTDPCWMAVPDTTALGPTRGRKYIGFTPDSAVIAAVNPFEPILVMERARFKKRIIALHGPTAGSPIDSIIKQAVQLLDTKKPDYKTLIPMLEAAKTNASPEQVRDINQILAYAYQMNKQYDRAIGAYQAFLNEMNAPSPEDDWYLLILFMEDPATYRKEIQAQIQSIESSGRVPNLNRLKTIKAELEKAGFEVK